MPDRQINHPSQQVRAHKAASQRPKAIRPRIPVSRYDERPPFKIKTGIIKAAALTVLLLTIFVYFGVHHSRVHANTASPKITRISNAQLAQLDNSITNLIGTRSQDTISVLATDMTTGQSVAYGSTNTYTAASTAKLLSAVYFLHQTETGHESLSEYLSGVKASDLLEQMIVNSDDTAWTSINDELTHSSLASYSATIGFTGYNVLLNTMPASDIQLLLTKLYGGKLLNKADTTLLLREMARANYRDYIVAGTPSGYAVYHKAGLIDDNIHDAAIITQKGNAGHAIAVTIFTDGNGTYDSAERTTLIRQITSQLTAAFLP
jgi:beta-lactamase class A